MGCGCKNKGNQVNTNTQQVSTQQTNTQQNNNVQSESIKASIKKTIEKYYNVNKTSR